MAVRRSARSAPPPMPAPCCPFQVCPAVPIVPWPGDDLLPATDSGGRYQNDPNEDGHSVVTRGVNGRHLSGCGAFGTITGASRCTVNGVGNAAVLTVTGALPALFHNCSTAL